MNLSTLPAELIGIVLGFLTRPQDLISVALTHSSLRTVSIEQLYLHLNDRSHRNDGERKLQQLIRCIKNHGQLLQITQSLVLRNWTSGTLMLHPLRQMQAYNRMLGSLLRDSLTNLRDLDTAYPTDADFLTGSLPHLTRLERLSVEPLEEGFSWTDLRTMNLLFLLTALRSTTLKVLCLSVFIPHDQLLFRYYRPCSEPINTSVRDISISVGRLPNRLLHFLIREISELKAFTLRPISIGSSRRRIAGSRTGLSMGLASYLPSMSFVGQVLNKHSKTLERLVLQRGCASWHRALNTIGSLVHFSALRSLSKPLETMLGWNHCEHIRSLSDQQPEPPGRLASLLPSSLEALELTLNDYHHHRNGTDYVYAGLQSILNDRARLTQLKQITIDGTDNSETICYCLKCESALQPPHNELKCRTNISVEEKLRVIQMVNDQFDLIFKPDQQWKEASAKQRETRKGQKQVLQAQRSRRAGLRDSDESWQDVLRPR